MRREFRDLIQWVGGFILARPKLGKQENYAAEGSSNVLFLGQSKPKPFKGLTEVSGVGATQSEQVSDGVAGFAPAP